MGLIALLLFSASDWCNKIPTSELYIFMNSGFLNPWKPVFVHFIMPKMLQTIKKNMETSVKHIIFISHHLENPRFSRCVALPDINNV